MARILYIEDDPNLTQLLGEIFLPSKGFRVEIAHDGLEGVEKARRWRPDLILLDLLLPQLDGLTVMKTLKQDLATQDIPVIAITALPTRQNRQLVEAAGGRAFVPKPFHPNDLLNLIRQNLPQPELVHS